MLFFLMLLRPPISTRTDTRVPDPTPFRSAVVRLAVRAKGKERIMLVTDAMPSVGTDVSEFTLQGKRIAVKDGVCIFEDGTLAGTHLDMASALRKTVEVTGLSVPDVSAMARDRKSTRLNSSH